MWQRRFAIAFLAGLVTSATSCREAPPTQPVLPAATSRAGPSLDSGPLTSSSTDTPQFLISPISLEFGEVPVGTTSASQVVNVKNVSSAPVVMSGTGGAPNRSTFGGVQNCQGRTLNPGDSCQLFYTFTPAAAGPDSAVASGTWNGQSYSVRMRGKGVTGLLISPTSLEFGEVPVGTTSASQVVNVKNVSSAPVVMSGTGGAPNRSTFGGVQNCQGRTLNPGDSCQLFYTFTPAAAGPDSAVASGTWNGQGYSIRLKGTGIPSGSSPSATFVISPTALTFGDVPLGTTSASQVVNVKNVSSAPVVMSGTGGAPNRSTFGGVQNCQGRTLNPGDSCQLFYTFTPAAAGPDSAVASGTWNGQGYSIQLKGTGTTTGLLISPIGLDFGVVPVGTTSASQVVNVKNVSSAPVVMSGTGGAPNRSTFGGVQNCQGRTLNPGDSCQLFYTFTPAAAGPDSAVASGTWNGQSYSIRLIGRAPGAETREMDLTPSKVSLAHTASVGAILLSSAGFDATAVTLVDVEMLVNGSTDVAPTRRAGSVISSVRDWNGDGLLDRMFSFRTADLKAAGLAAGAGADALLLHGTLSGTEWTARDAAPPSFVP